MFQEPSEKQLARQWLEDAARIAGLGSLADEFARVVFSKLTANASCLQREIDELFCEPTAQGADLAAQALLMALRIYREAEELGQVQLTLLRLQEVAANGMRAWWAYREGESILAEVEGLDPIA